MEAIAIWWSKGGKHERRSHNRRSRQSSEQGSQGRPVCPFFLPVALSQCSACLHYCKAHPLLHHCCFLHPQQTSTCLQYIQTQNTAQFFFLPKCILSYLKTVGQCSGSGVPFSSFCWEWDDYISKRKTTGRELKSWVWMECFTQYIRVSWLEKGKLGRRCWCFPFPNLSELILCSHSVADGSSENTSIFLTFLPSLPAIVQRQVERLEYYVSLAYPIQSANSWTSSRWTKNPSFVPFHFLSHKLLSKQN